MVVTVLLLMRPKPAPAPLEAVVEPTLVLLSTVTPLPTLTPFPTQTPPPTFTPAPTATPSPAPTESLTSTAALTATEVVTYVVASGDTLSEIASAYGVTVDDLMAANDLADEILDIGQVLTIPSDAAGALAGTAVEMYVVKSGDTLGAIAKQFQVSVDDLKQANNLDSDLLQLGQKLVIPTGGE
jgi:LysM repeat protein